MPYESSADEEPQPKWKQRYWPRLESLEESYAVARKVEGGWLFALLILLGAAVTYFSGKSALDLSTPEPDTTGALIGELIEFAFVIYASYRIRIGRGWFVSWLLLALFAAEVVLKMMSAGPNVAGWLIAYFFAAASIVSGARACWDIRSRIMAGESA